MLLNLFINIMLFFNLELCIDTKIILYILLRVRFFFLIDF